MSFIQSICVVSHPVKWSQDIGIGITLGLFIHVLVSGYFGRFFAAGVAEDLNL